MFSVGWEIISYSIIIRTHFSYTQILIQVFCILFKSSYIQQRFQKVGPKKCFSLHCLNTT